MSYPATSTELLEMEAITALELGNTTRFTDLVEEIADRTGDMPEDVQQRLLTTAADGKPLPRYLVHYCVTIEVDENGAAVAATIEDEGMDFDPLDTRVFDRKIDDWTRDAPAGVLEAANAIVATLVNGTF